MAVNGTRLDLDACRYLADRTQQPNVDGKKSADGERWRGGARKCRSCRRPPRGVSSREGPAVPPPCGGRPHGGRGEGPDLIGTNRVAPGLTRCHESHDVGPPFIAAARRCHVFLIEPSLLSDRTKSSAIKVFRDPSLQPSLRDAAYDLYGNTQLFLTLAEPGSELKHLLSWG